MIRIKPVLAPERRPLERGTCYATTAGVRVGSHEHTHFEFKIARPRKVTHNDQTNQPPSASDPASISVPVDFDDESPRAQQHPEVLHLDPWIVFWQIFEDRKDRKNRIRARI